MGMVVKIHKDIIIAVVLMIAAMSVSAQNTSKAQEKLSLEKIAQIKQNSNTYLYGEATGKSVNIADRDALADLIGQISTSVESSFTLIKDENPDEYKETFNAVVKTYSKATLNNTERIITGKEPKITVFRYIKRVEVRKIFAARQQKIVEFTKSAVRAEQKLQIADALRYYYWAQTLLRSHPDGARITYDDDDTGQQYLLAAWIPEQINNIFSNIRVAKGNVKVDGNFQEVELFFTYKNQPVSNFDFTYWDGYDWSNIVSAKDGRGVAELPTLAETDKINLKGEYVFVGEATIDSELKDVMESLEPVPYKSCSLTLTGTGSARKEKIVQKEIQQAQIENAAKTESVFNYVKSAPYEKTMIEIEQCIVQHKYDAARKYFNDEGWEMFEKLISYGRAKIYGSPDYRFAKTDDGVICRSLPLIFSFPGSKRTFVEDVVFEFDTDGKINGLSFGLSQTTLKDIVDKKMWDESSRLTLIRFLENYKTAYALKRLDYINSIFANDALIIVGHVLEKQAAKDAITITTDKQAVRYTTQTKEQYIKNLGLVFRSNEFINLRFADSEIRKAGTGEIYGIQIKQDYFSSNYGDTGYLFLMVDLNDKDKPVIHVRAWQPEKDPDFGLIDLSSFSF